MNPLKFIESIILSMIYVVILFDVFSYIYLSYTTVETPKTYDNDATQLALQIAKEFDINHSITVSYSDTCPGCLASVRITNDTADITIKNGNGMDLEGSIKHELGHVKEPIWWDWTVHIMFGIVFSLMAIAIYVNDIRIALYSGLVGMFYPVWGKELVAYYYSEPFLFNFTLWYMFIFLGRGLWLVFENKRRLV